MINAKKAKQDARHYPANNRPQWGPGHDLEAIGLKPLTHKRGMVHVDNGEVEMRFSAEKDVKFLPKVHSNTRTADSLTGFVIHWAEDGKICLKMRFPEAGDYALNLYAREKRDTGNDGLPNVCSYLLSSGSPAADGPFFISGNGQLGATDDFHKLRMQAVSQPSPYVQDPKNGEMDFLFRTPIPCDLLVELILCRGKEQNMEGFTFIDKKPDKATVKARFPETGNYTLKVYGKEKKKENESFPLVFAYSIVVNQPMSDCFQFPKKYSDWTEGCELSEPDLGAPLLVDQTVSFAVKIPKAQDVAVTHPTAGWTHLAKDKQQMWRGDVNTGSEAEQDISLCARFSADAESFSILLELSLIHI